MFSKYILQFTKNVDQKQTHLSFNKGKYNVPDEKFEEFYKNYYRIITNESDVERKSLYLIEKVYNSNFAYFLDLDIKNRDVDDEDILDVIEVVQTNISKMFKTVEDKNICEYIVSKRVTETGSNYHINFYNLIVNNVIGKKLTLKILENKSLLSGDIKSSIDLSVYRTGLRLLGSRKDIKNKDNLDYISDIYRIYNLENQKFIELKDTTYEQFLKTIVKRKLTTQITEVIEDKIKIKDEETVKKQNIPVKGINNDKIVFELTKLLNTLKLTNEILQDFDVSIQRIYASQNKMGLFCYYVSINGKYCPFKTREHSRPQSPIYFEISTSGIYLKCYDEECLRRRFPEEGLSLPENFEKDYSQVYLSMTTKYWHSDITITDEMFFKNLENTIKVSQGTYYVIEPNIAKGRILLKSGVVIWCQGFKFGSTSIDELVNAFDTEVFAFLRNF